MNKILAIASVVVREMFRRKDFYVLFVISVLLCLIMGSVNIFNDDKVVRYLKELSLLLIWISSLVIAVTTAARQIPAEREARTLYPLLAKPVNRAQVVLGKFLGCWIASAGALFVFYLFFTVLSLTRESGVPIINYFQAAALHWVMLGIVIAFCVFGSLVFSAVSANITISFAAVLSILFLGRYLNVIALKQEEPLQSLLMVIYYTIPHLELFDVRDLIIHGWPAIPWAAWTLALLYGAAFAGVFLALSCWVFQRKAINS